MKYFKHVAILLVVLALAISAFPVNAQLGGTAKSSFSVQNMDDVDAEVLVTFMDASGASFTPTVLVPASGSTPEIPNPFTLAPGKSQEIYVPSIPTDQLPAGQYSVVLSSSANIVATVNLLGEGSVNFNGTYNGVAEAGGSNTYYMPAFLYNYYGWYSAVTVQNISNSEATDITLSITCSNGTTGSYTATDVEAGTAVTFDSRTTLPTGFSGTSVKCDGSAEVESTVAPIIAIDNQTVPTAGFTQSFTGIANGAKTLYVPSLFVSYYNWDSSINVQKIGAGDTTVTVTYSDGATPTTFTLTDDTPGHLFYMPTTHPLGTGQVRAQFAATITSDTLDIIAVANSATKTSGQAQSYVAVPDVSGTSTVLVPGAFKNYYGWISSIGCQNVSETATSLNISYDGYSANAYDTDELLGGETIEIPVFGETFLPDKFVGGATVTANTEGALISCVINHNNSVQMTSTVGDWSTSTNAFNK